MAHNPPLPLDVLLAASHARVSTRIGRWLVHDVRGPLQGVSLTLALLAEPGPAGPAIDDELRSALASAADDFAHIVDLVDQLLRLPPLGVEPGPVVLGDVLGECERLFEHRRTRAAVTWPAAAAVAALPPVRGVAEQVRHALLPLLLLATDVAGPGPDGRIVVTCDAEDDVVGLRVAAGSADAEPLTPGDPLLLDGSRALLELSGGSLVVTGTGTTATYEARLARWRAVRGLDE